MSYLLYRNRGLLMVQAEVEARPLGTNVKTVSSLYLIFINYIHYHLTIDEESTRQEVIFHIRVRTKMYRLRRRAPVIQLVVMLEM